MFDTAQAQELFLQGEDAFSADLGDRRAGHQPGGAARRGGRGAARGLPGAPPGDATAAPSRQPHRRGAVVRHDLPPRLRRRRPDRRGVPHRQHVLDPRGAAQPRARAAAGDRGQPSAGGAVGAPRGGRRRPRRLGHRRRPRRACSPSGIKLLFGRFGLDLSANALVLEPRTVVVASSSACSSRWRRPTCRRGGPDACRRSPRCATTWPSPRAACAGGSPWAPCCSSPGSAAMAAGLAGVGTRAHLRARCRCLRGARRHRAAQPRARPAGARRARVGLPARVRGGRPDGRAERPAQPPPHRCHRLGADDRRGPRDDDGDPRRVGEGQPRQDPGRGHRRRLRRVATPSGQAFSRTVADDVERCPAWPTVARVRAALLQLDGDRDFASASTRIAMTAVARPDVVTGSLARPRRVLGRRLDRPRRGARAGASGRPSPIEYAGEERPSPSSRPTPRTPRSQSDVTMSLEAASTRSASRRPTARSTSTASRGSRPGRPATRALEAVVATCPRSSINDQATFAAEQREPIDQLLFIVYALLGLAVVIAVLGIVNTLALSVIERIREIGLLRAVGLSRRQLRTMLRLESVAIALLGAVLGVVVGLAFALALQRSLADDGLDVLAIPPSWPEPRTPAPPSWPAPSSCRSPRAAAGTTTRARRGQPTATESAAASGGSDFCTQAAGIDQRVESAMSDLEGDDPSVPGRLHADRRGAARHGPAGADRLGLGRDGRRPRPDGRGVRRLRHHRPGLPGRPGAGGGRPVDRERRTWRPTCATSAASSRRPQTAGLGAVGPQRAQPAGQEVALDGVLGQQQRLLVGLAGLLDPAEPPEEVGPRGGQVAVAGQLRFRRTARRARRARPPPRGRSRRATARLSATTGDGQSVVSSVVQGDDLAPVGVVPGRRLRVDGRDRRLQGVARRGPRPQRLPDEGHALGDRRPVPPRAVLLLEQQQPAVRGRCGSRGGRR